MNKVLAPRAGQAARPPDVRLLRGLPGPGPWQATRLCIHLSAVAVLRVGVYRIMYVVEDDLITIERVDLTI